MAELTNEEFITFLESYKSKKGCYDTLSNISWPKKDGKNIPGKEPLIESDFHMYSLDDMCELCKTFNNDNLPTTTDALWYKINDNGKLVLYFIEFKWHNLDRPKDKNSLDEIITEITNNMNSNKKPVNSDIMNRLKMLKKSLVDEDIGYSLRLKPFESLFIVLPTMYKEYCQNDCKDIVNFIKNCEIKIFTFVNIFTPPKEDKPIEKRDEVKDKPKSMRIDTSDLNSKNKKRNRRNKSKDRNHYIRSTGPKGSIGATVYKQYKRYQHSPFIKFADIYPRHFFDFFLEDEGLV